MKEDDYIHFPLKWTAIWMCFLVLLLAFGIYLTNMRVDSLNHLSYEKKMDTIYVLNPHNNRRGTTTEFAESSLARRSER